MQNPLLLYALLLAGVMSGWWLGARFPHWRQPSERPNFIPSIEYLLADVKDAALNKMLEGQALTEDNLDLFLKLGRTLRAKGDTQRAIHLHQSLFARTDLPRTLLLKLKLELALDYFEAGLLDRAERILFDFVQHKGKEPIYNTAAEQLVKLYEEENEWEKINALYQERKLPRDESMHQRVAHAYCERAERAVKQRHFLEAHQLCRLALKKYSQCNRAYVVQGNLAYSQGEMKEAIRCYLRALELNPKTIVNVLEPLNECLMRTGDLKSAEYYFQQQWRISQYEPALKLYIQLLLQREGSDTALDQLLLELSENPSNQGFAILAELMVRHEQPIELLQMQKLYDILRTILKHESKFVCDHCGFKVNQFHWLCPSCKQWGTLTNFVPRQTKSKLEL